MFVYARWFLATALLATVGFGCWWNQKPSYVPAEPVNQIEVTPSVEGGQASTGGESATITPNTAIDILIAALPAVGDGWTAADPVEKRDPVPLPDGTRAEYVSIQRAYQFDKNGTEDGLEFLLTDTRGIPALLAFVDSYAERRDAAGYRTAIKIGDQDAWLTYAFGANAEQDGSGSIMFVLRERFIIQIDAKQGTSVQTIMTLAERFNPLALN